MAADFHFCNANQSVDTTSIPHFVEYVNHLVSMQKRSKEERCVVLEKGESAEETTLSPDRKTRSGTIAQIVPGCRRCHLVVCVIRDQPLDKMP